MGVTALEVYHEPSSLTRAGEDARAICDAWSERPEGARFAQSLVTFLGSKSNPGTQRVYSLALYEFFAWAQRANGTMPLPNQVLRVDAARFTKWLEERQASLDEDRLALEVGRELDAEIIRFVRANVGTNIGQVRRHLLANDVLACDVNFSAQGREHATRSLVIEAHVPRGDELERYVSVNGKRPVEPLDLKLAQLCSQNFLRRTPSVAEIRSGKSGLQLDKPGQAQIGYRVDPKVFKYRVNERSTAQGGDRASTIVNKLSVLSAYWSWLVKSSAENIKGHTALLQVNIWREPIAALRPKSINRRKQHREASVPSVELLARVLETTYRSSHGKDSLRAAEAALQGVDLTDSAVADAPLVDLRDRAMILFLYWCGVRAEELGSVRRRDLDPRTGLVVVTGKGDFVRSFRVPEPAMLALVAFHEVLDSVPAKPSTLRSALTHRDAPLFPPLRLWGKAAHASAVSPESVQGVQRSGLARLLQDRATKAGIDRHGPDWERIHPHGLRHLAALDAVRRGVDVATVQATLGHRSLATTGIYLEVRDPLQRCLQPDK